MTWVQVRRELRITEIALIVLGIIVIIFGVIEYNLLKNHVHLQDFNQPTNILQPPSGDDF